MYEVNIVSAWEEICHSFAHSFDRRIKETEGETIHHFVWIFLVDLYRHSPVIYINMYFNYHDEK